MKRIVGMEELAVYATDFLGHVSPKENEAYVVGLRGELGSGKTAFVQCIARALGVDEQVTSPTFVIEKIYKLKDQKFEKLIHIDTYRLESGKELLSLGWDDIVRDSKNLILIEWPELVAEVIPSGTHTLYFKYINEETRTIETHGKEN